MTEVYKYTLGEIGFINKITITTEDKTTEYNVLYDADGHLKGVEEGMEMKWTDGEYTGYFLYTLKASNIPFHGFVPYNAIPGAATDAALYRQGLFRQGQRTPSRGIKRNRTQPGDNDIRV